MASKERIAALGVTIQPTPGTFNAPGVNDLIPISSPDNGEDIISTDDDTLTGALWSAPRQFLGSRGRAGATARLRGPGGATPPAAGVWPLGRILMAAGFTEIRNAAAITATVAANADASAVVLDAAASAVDDFYNGYPIQHAGIGSGIRGTSMVRDYVGSTKKATLMETLGAAISAGSYTIPPGLFYILSTGLAIPALSCSVWRHKVRYDYRDCALNSFAINIPVANEQSTETPSVEFSMVGVPITPTDQNALSVPDSAMTPVPPARAGKFVLLNTKVGHQSLRLEFGLESGAPPNQNNDTGQEAYEILSGNRTVSLDVNQMLQSELNIKAAVDAQTSTSIMSIWGLGSMNRFAVGIPEAVLDPLGVAGRNGFVGVSANASPTNVDKSISIAVF